MEALDWVLKWNLEGGELSAEGVATYLAPCRCSQRLACTSDAASLSESQPHWPTSSPSCAPHRDVHPTQRDVRVKGLFGPRALFSGKMDSACKLIPLVVQVPPTGKARLLGLGRTWCGLQVPLLSLGLPCRSPGLCGHPPWSRTWPHWHPSLPAVL